MIARRMEIFDPRGGLQQLTWRVTPTGVGGSPRRTHPLCPCIAGHGGEG